MTTTIIITGQPGAGKTTLTRALVAPWMEITAELKPVKHTTYDTPHGPAIQLGWNKPPFGGTDTLSQSAINTVEEWYPHIGNQIVIVEGDRLANDRFINIAKQHGPVHHFHLTTPNHIAEQRRTDRAEQHNLKTQNPTWVTGRITKHNNLAERHNATPLDGTQNPETLANEIRYYLS